MELRWRLVPYYRYWQGKNKYRPVEIKRVLQMRAGKGSRWKDVPEVLIDSDYAAHDGQPKEK